MEKTVSILVLRLEGVLQSWGEHSHWISRDTADMPTKSGIIGLLGCALGFTRGDPRLLKLWKELKVGIRADRPGQLLTDYHTVQSEKLLSANGKKRSGGNTFFTYRDYLQDACFTVALEGEKELLKKLEEALKKPRWPVYLGRKSCVPSRPVLDCLTDQYSSLYDAICHIPFAGRSDRRGQDKDKTAEYDLSTGLDTAVQNGIVYFRPDGMKPGVRKFCKRKAIRNSVPTGR